MTPFALLACGVGLAGCGFVGASNVAHNKPSGFVLRGQVTMAVPPPATQSVGADCTSPYPDIVPNALVKVTDPDGHEMALGYLGDGVIAHGQTGVTCNFPFQIPAVPGGVSSYRIAVASRPGQTFPASTLRQSAEATLTVS